MNILCASDNNYVSPCLILLQSIFDNNDNDITVWYLHTSLSVKNKKTIQKLEMKNGGKLNLIRVKDEIFENAPINGYFTKEMYFRILAANLLPNTLDRVLYLDSDIIVKGNIDKFYNQDFSRNDTEYLFVVCADQGLNNFHVSERHQRLGIPMEKTYFNSGVMLMNLEMMRREMDLSNVFNFISDNYEKLKLPDQDLLNALYYNHVLLDDEQQYNLMVDSYSSTSYKKFRAAKIIHYAGPRKPWKYGYYKMGEKLYKEYAFKSGCGIWYMKSKIKSFIQNCGK